MPLSFVGPKRGYQERNGEINLRNNLTSGNLDYCSDKIVNQNGSQAEHDQKVLLPARIRPDKAGEQRPALCLRREKPPVNLRICRNDPQQKLRLQRKQHPPQNKERHHQNPGGLPQTEQAATFGARFL